MYFVKANVNILSEDFQESNKLWIYQIRDKQDICHLFNIN